MPDATNEITRMLVQLSNGNREILDSLLPVVITELRQMAANHMRRERRGHTMQATELVNEAYLKLIAQEALSFKNRSHFFAISALAMRQILVDYAKQRSAGKRGGGVHKLSLDDTAIISEDRADHLLALDAALKKLEAFDERQGKVVTLRYFTGLTIEETAEAMGISPVTVKREWRMAKAWLYRELNIDNE